MKNSTAKVILIVLCLRNFLSYGQGYEMLRTINNTGRSIAFDVNENIVTCTANGTLITYTPEGVLVNSIATNLPKDYQDIHIDLSGNIYTSILAGYGMAVRKFNSSGIEVATWGQVTSQAAAESGDSLLHGRGIGIDAGGNILVVGGLRNSVFKYTNTGTFISKFGKTGTGPGEFDYPVGLALDASGNIYVADENNHRVQKFTSNGTFLMQFGTLGSEDGQFNKPSAVAVDKDGNIFVGERGGNGRIQKFNSSGQFIEKFGEGSPWLYIKINNAGDVFCGYDKVITVFRYSATATSLKCASDQHLKLFPNPFNTETFISIEDPASFVKLTIYSISGMLLYEDEQVPANTNYMLPELSPGTYYVKIIGSKGTLTKKLVKY